MNAFHRAPGRIGPPLKHFVPTYCRRCTACDAHAVGNAFGSHLTGEMSVENRAIEIRFFAGGRVGGKAKPGLAELLVSDLAFGHLFQGVNP